MGCLIAVNQADRVPTEHDDLATLTAIGMAAMAEINFRERPYLSGRYWLLGKCLIAGKIKFGPQKKMYRLWRNSICDKEYECTNSCNIARRFATKAEAEEHTVQEAFQISKQKIGKKCTAQPLDNQLVLLQAKQKMDDVVDNLAHENDDDAFLQCYYRLQEIQEMATELLARHAKRFELLTDGKPSPSPKKNNRKAVA